MRSFIAPLSDWKGPAAVVLAAALFFQSLPLAPIAVRAGVGADSGVETSVRALNICDGESDGGTAGQAERLCAEPPSAAAPSSVRFFPAEFQGPFTFVITTRLFRPPRS
jgi:hypothetical protein